MVRWISDDFNSYCERIEIFADRSSIVIDDFKDMELHGFEEKKIKLKKQDKEHYQELSELAKLLKGQETGAITFDESVKSMKITFEVNKLTRKIM